jgi:hypothetical protein
MDKIEVNLREIGWVGMDLIDLAQGSCEHNNELWVPRNAGKFLSSCTTGSVSRKAQFHD